MSRQIITPDKQFIFRTAVSVPTSAVIGSIVSIGTSVALNLSTAFIVLDRKTGHLGFNIEDPIAKFHFLGDAVISGNLRVVGTQIVERTTVLSNASQSIINTGSSPFSTALLVQTESSGFPLVIMQTKNPQTGIIRESLRVQNNTLFVENVNVTGNINAKDIEFVGDIFRKGRRFRGADEVPEIKPSVNSFTMDPEDEPGATEGWITNVPNSDVYRRFRSIYFRKPIKTADNYSFKRTFVLYDPNVVGFSYIATPSTSRFLGPPGKYVIQVTYLLDQGFQKVSLLLDNIVLEKEIDLYTPGGLGSTRQMVTYTAELSSGAHELEIRGLSVSGEEDRRNLSSTGYGFGIGDVTLLNLGFVGNVIKLTDAEANNLVVNSSITIRADVVNNPSVPGIFRIYNKQNTSFLQLRGGSTTDSIAVIEALDSLNNNTIPLAIQPNANVGFGTSDPRYRLDMRGNVHNDFIARVLNSNVNGSGILIESASSSSSQYPLLIRNAADTVQFMAVTGQGKVGYNTKTPVAGVHYAFTDAVVMPSGTSLQRPNGGVNGMIRYNSEIRIFEYYNEDQNGGNQWKPFTLSDSGTFLPRMDSPTGIYFLGTTAGSGVGIGADNPNFQLDVYTDSPFRGTSTSAGIRVFKAGGQSIIMTVDPSSGDGSLRATNGLRLTTGGVDRMVVRDNGNVGVGTTVPTSTLQVVGNVAATGNLSIGGTLTVNSVSLGANPLVVMGLSTAGNVTAANINIASGLGVSGTSQLNNVNVSGNLITTGQLSAANLTVNSIIRAGGLSTAGNIAAVRLTLSDGLTFTSGIMSVAGVTFLERLSVSGNLSVGGLMAMGGLSVGTLHSGNILGGQLTLTNGITFTSGVMSVAGTTLLTQLSVSGNVSVAGRLTASSLSVLGTGFVGGLSTAGNISADRLILTSGITFASGVMSVAGTTLLAQLSVSGRVTSSSISVGGAGFVGGLLTVVGGLSTAGNISADRLILTSGITFASGVMSVAGTTLLTQLSVSGNVSAGGRLTTSSISVGGAVAMGGSLSVFGTGFVGGSLSVGQNLVASSISVGGAVAMGLRVDGNVSVGGQLVLNQGITFTSGVMSVAGVTILDRLSLQENLSVGGHVRIGMDLITHGRVGVNTSSPPISSLDVNGQGTFIDRSLSGLDGNGIRLGNNTKDDLMIQGDSAGFRFADSTQQFLRISSTSGNFYLGGSDIVTNPDYRLDVEGDINFTGKVFQNGVEYGPNFEPPLADPYPWRTADNDPNESIVPVGAYLGYSDSAPLPLDYLRCAGGSIPRVDYPELFGVIGTVYGAGDGITTFQIPLLANTIIKYRISSAGLGTVPLASILYMDEAFYNTNLPEYYRRCDGSELNREGFRALFDTVGTIYGTGDGSITFNLPILSHAIIKVLMVPSGEREIFPIGAGLSFSSSLLVVPVHYIRADGSLISRSAYSELYKVIGQTYGMGDGLSTFQLPTLANLILRFKDSVHITYMEGRVGVRQSNPQYTLDVNGDIHFTGEVYKNGEPWREDSDAPIPQTHWTAGEQDDQEELIPTGAFVSFPQISPPPPDYLFCDGSEISRVVYAELFAVMGTTYGVGDGVSTFLLPTMFNMIIKYQSATGTHRGRVFVGSYMSYSWTSGIPPHYLACDGTAVSRYTYEALFAVLGTAYGVGDGFSTFNLPFFFNYIIKFDYPAGGVADSLPQGLILNWAGTIPPPHYIFADGLEVSRHLYSELFETVGIAYGAGNGYTTFQLPSLYRAIIRYTRNAETIFYPGRVGILESNPQYTLDVKGDIHFTGGVYKNGEPWREDSEAPIPQVHWTACAREEEDNLIPTGAFLNYPQTSTLPGDYLRCDGSAVSRLVYTELFAVIGTAYGAGDGTTTFNLPFFFDMIIKFRPSIVHPTRVFIGSYLRYPWTGPLPGDYLRCDGSAVSRLVYTELFAVIGTAYGAGDGTTTFNLPFFFNYIIKFDYLGDDLPQGLMLAYGGSTVPQHYLFADGAEVSRHLYSELFDIVGISYGGGNGYTTFNLPLFFNTIIRYTRNAGAVCYPGKVAIGKPTANYPLDVEGVVHSKNTPKAFLSMVLDYFSNTGTFKYTFLRSFNVETVDYSTAGGNVNILNVQFAIPMSTRNYVIQSNESPFYYDGNNDYLPTGNYVSRLAITDYTPDGFSCSLFGAAGQNLTPGRLDFVVYDSQANLYPGTPTGTVS